MSHVTPVQSSFNGGELSPRVRDRIDLSVRQIGVKTMLGWLPTVQGSAEACPGTVRMAGAPSGAIRLIPYVFNTTQSYIIILTDHKARFITNGVEIMAGGVPYEIATPWSGLDLAELTYEQSMDVLYIYHPDTQTRKLARTSATTFNLTMVAFDGGPFGPRNRSRSITVQASTSEGNVTITATHDIFQQSDVGRLFRMEAVDLGNVPHWDVGMSVTLGHLRQSNGCVYQAMTSGKTGGIAPVHTEGVEWDGMQGADANSQTYGVQWAYLHDRFGLARINGFINSKAVTALVLRRLPYSVSATGSYGGAYNGYTPTEYDPETESWTNVGIAGVRRTWRWQFGVFSNTTGWPQCGRIFDERHCVGFQSTIYASVNNDLENFAPLNELGDPSRDMAFTHMLPTADYVQWMAVDGQLLAGTATSEWTIGPSSAAQGIGPGAVQSRKQSGNGATLAMPILTDGRVVFIQRSRSQLMEYGYRVDRDRYETPNLLRFADHIGDRGIKEIAYQNAPAQLIWAVLDNGTLACCVYEPSEEVLGWAQRELGAGWRAVSIATIPDEEGRYDELWIAARDPADNNHILRMQRIRSATNSSRLRVMTDAAWIYDEDVPTAELDIPWLAGLTVQVVAGNGQFEQVKLDGQGKAMLSDAYHQIIAGVPFPARLELLPFEAGGDNGPALGKKGHINRVGLILVNSGELAIEVQGSLCDLQMDTANIIGEPSPLKSGIYWVQGVGKWDRRREVTIVRHLPFSQTIVGVMAETTMQQHGGRE